MRAVRDGTGARTACLPVRGHGSGPPLRDPHPVLALQMSCDLRQGHVRGLFDQRQDRRSLCLDPVRAPVAALRPGPIAACSLPSPNPLDRRGRRDAEALAWAIPAVTSHHPPPSPPGGADHPKEVVSCRLASFTSLHLESHIQAIENFKDSLSLENALVSGKAVEQPGAAGAYQTFLAAASGRMSGVP